GIIFDRRALLRRRARSALASACGESAREHYPRSNLPHRAMVTVRDGPRTRSRCRRVARADRRDARTGGPRSVLRTLSSAVVGTGEVLQATEVFDHAVGRGRTELAT